MPRKLKGGSLSSDEVKKFVQASYENNKGTTDKIGDYVRDTELSTAKAKVFFNPTTKKVVVANRGTKGTLSDWKNNLEYLRGNYENTDRFKQALDVQQKAIAKYGKVDYNVGHSQSGAITRGLNKRGLSQNVVNVNPASMFETQKKNEFVIRSKTDPVSILHALNPFAKKENTTTIEGTSNLLKEHSADILTRIDPNQQFGTGKKGKGKLITNELTNFDIDDYMKFFKIKNYHGCFIKNELPELNDGFFVINLNGQSHWTCLCKDGTEYLYYDSFGFPAPIEVENAIKKDGGQSYVSMENQIQNIDHTSCGFYVIAFCKYLNNKKDKLKAYEEFIAHFTDETEINDQILKKMLKI